MGSDGALDTDISERKALGWMITALSDESSVIDALYETIEGGMDGDHFPRLTYVIVRCVDEHALNHTPNMFITRSRLFRPVSLSTTP